MKRGFTIVELLAVISIMAILLILAVPTLLRARENTLAGISKEQERSLQEAGRMVGVDLDDYHSKIYNCKTDSWINDKCTRVSNKWIEVKLSVEDLKEHGYFQDTKGHCQGELTVTKEVNSDGTSSSAGYGVTLNSVKC